MRASESKMIQRFNDIVTKYQDVINKDLSLQSIFLDMKAIIIKYYPYMTQDQKKEFCEYTGVLENRCEEMAKIHQELVRSAFHIERYKNGLEGRRKLCQATQQKNSSDSTTS